MMAVTLRMVIACSDGKLTLRKSVGLTIMPSVGFIVTTTPGRFELLTVELQDGEPHIEAEARDIDRQAAIVLDPMLKLSAFYQRYGWKNAQG